MVHSVVPELCGAPTGGSDKTDCWGARNIDAAQKVVMKATKNFLIRLTAWCLEI